MCIYDLGKADVFSEVHLETPGQDIVSHTVIAMVVFVKILKNGTLVRIKEVPDTYRDRSYIWDEDE